ncbi:MAG: FeoB-associated Cys-rich membrane protein [Clostridia bacterium]|nr:FeoB-associated Cys-rich membrane protein [Clostridia bacterium]
MLLWLETNAGTIIVCLALAAVVALIVRGRIKNKKRGGSSCGCGCENCALRGKCGGK